MRIEREPRYMNRNGELIIESIFIRVLLLVPPQCWGSNEAGQLGLGDSFNRGDDVGEMGVNLPYVDLGANVTVSSITAGHRHSCAVVDSGGVKCWGKYPALSSFSLLVFKLQVGHSVCMSVPLLNESAEGFTLMIYVTIFR